MALVAMQCKNCGGILNVDSNAEKYYCPHCDTPYVMEQTIQQNFQTTTIETATIIDDGNGRIEHEIDSAEAFLKLGKYLVAKEKFKSLANCYAHKYRTWWGLARAITEEFTRSPDGEKEFSFVYEAVTYATQLAPSDEKQKIVESSSAYINKWQDYRLKLREVRSQQCNNIEGRTNEILTPKYEKVNALLSKINKKTKKLKKIKIIAGIILLIGFLVLALLQFIAYVNEMGVIGALFVSILASIICIATPLGAIFFLIIKAVKASMGLTINRSYKEINKIEAEINEQKNRRDSEMRTLYIHTGWLDR